MRVCHGYGSLNPCAIEIAPVGRAADYDLNLADTSPSAWSQNSSYMRVTLSSANVIGMELGESDGTTLALTTLPDSALLTLQSLVDRINATNVATDGRQ